ncbi:hypothetical protein [Streptomyces shenzhenensis]
MTRELRTVWLFGRPYWWDRLPNGRLTLRPAAWITKERRDG